MRTPFASGDPESCERGGLKPGPVAPSAYFPPAVLFVERLEAQANTCSPTPYAKAVVTLSDCNGVTSS